MSGLDEHDEMYALEGEFKRLTAENAETRMVLRQFYGADEPVTSADIARKMLDEIARLRAELLDAAALHLADEQSVRNMERRITSLTADLARVETESAREITRLGSELGEARHAAAECGRLRETAMKLKQELGQYVDAYGTMLHARDAALKAGVKALDQRDALLAAAKDIEPMSPDDPRDGICLVERRRLDALRAAVEACKEPTR